MYILTLNLNLKSKQKKKADHGTQLAQARARAGPLVSNFAIGFKLFMDRNENANSKTKQDLSFVCLDRTN